ncbi:MAG: SAM-dependent methyltransferase [Alphaproteobacteria bacterium]|nr:SAM-dependent methyltransferase [Alphaproteobacteria bacterium]
MDGEVLLEACPTPLAGRLARLIRAEGPIPVATFMSLALGDPEHGYYATRDPLGAAGDFTTAPEISQIFGELIGLCLVDHWLASGAPTPVHLVEAGPGRGTLMADLLRAAAVRPAFGEHLSLHLVETSPVLRERQRARLSAFAPVWHDRLADALAAAEGGALYFVANEFFDALPVRQFERTREGWRERLVGLGERGSLAFGLSPVIPAPPISEALRAAPVGSVAEISPLARALAGLVGDALVGRPGAALVLDYGYAEEGAGDTLQAVRGHAYAPPLDAPGEADLTAHVDFAALARAGEAAGALAHGPVPQGLFLERLGLAARARRLARAGDGGAVLAARRLADPSAMGTLFKALGLTGPGAPPLAGFAE